MFTLPVLLAAALTAAPASITLHPGATTTVTIAGAQGALAATSGAGLVSVTPDPSPQTFDVRASDATGSDTLRVTDAAGDALDVPVTVARDAGTFPAQLAVTITGMGVSWPWLWSQIQAAFGRASSVAPGAAIALAMPSASPAAPAPGASIVLDIPVRIAGPAYFDAFGSTRVTVLNAPVEPVAPPLLLYDDDPERVTGDGTIFRAAVTRAQAARLYYYHDDGGDPRRLIVALRAAQPSDVQVIDASAGPNLDVLSVGHAVSRDALDMTVRNEGIVLGLQPGVPVVLHDVTMTAKQGVAGAIGIQVLHGGPVEIEVASAAPGETVASALDAPLLPRDGHHRDGTFSIENFGAVALQYEAGGPDVSLQYGGRAAAPSNLLTGSNGTDFGDYGVLHTLLFSLVNPLAVPATVYLYERPLGGIVRSTFLVDGELQQIGCVRDSAKRYQIAAFALAPRGRYQLAVGTMTDGGSNYPIEIGLTGAAVEPAAPPISSPDGCFPKPVR